MPPPDAAATRDHATVAAGPRAGGRARAWRRRASLAVLVLCALTLVPHHWRGGLTSAGVVLAAAVPVIVLLALLAAVLAPRHHPRVRALLVAALLVGHAGLLDQVVPDPGGPPAGAVPLRVVALNTKWSGPADGSLRDLAAGSDVLVLQEWDDDRTATLSATLGADWQLAAVDHDDYIGADVAVWVRSTWTVAGEAPVAAAYPAATALTLRRDDARVSVVGTRLQNPAFRAADLWGRGLAGIASAAKGSDRPVVVLGDLNAPPSALAFRRTLDDAGLSDCAAQLGAGFPGTWGPGRGPVLAPVPIDHVLVGGGARCAELDTVRMAGTDHRAVRAEVSVPPG